MRILQVVDNLAIGSGVSTVVMNLYRNINRNVMQFDFLVMKHYKISYEDEIKSMGGNVFYVSSPLSLKTIRESIIETKSFFEKHSKVYDVVHLHSPTTAFFNLRYAKKYNIRNRIVHSHSTMFSKNKLKSLLNFILCFNLKQYANIYWACSEKAAEFLYGKKYLHNRQVEIINNAIDCDKYIFNATIREKYRQEFGITDKYVIGHVAGFNEIKNHSFLIEVFCKICKDCDDFVLVLVGDGATYQKSIDLVRARGIEDKVIFLGFRSDINNLMHSFDAFVLPSLKEGLPVAAVEAQASGLPCYLSSSITKEVDLGYVEYLDLDLETWSKCLQKKIINERRSSAYNLLKSSSFNVKNESDRVQNMYINIVRKEKNV